MYLPFLHKQNIANVASVYGASCGLAPAIYQSPQLHRACW